MFARRSRDNWPLARHSSPGFPSENGTASGHVCARGGRDGELSGTAAEAPPLPLAPETRVKDPGEAEPGGGILRPGNCFPEPLTRT